MRLLPKCRNVLSDKQKYQANSYSCLLWKHHILRCGSSVVTFSSLGEHKVYRREGGNHTEPGETLQPSTRYGQTMCEKFLFMKVSFG